MLSSCSRCLGAEKCYLIKLLSWNVRGLGRPKKRRKIKQVFCARRVDMVLLQETKRSTIDEKFVRSIWGREQMDFMTVDSTGAAGGLLCIWNPEVFQLVDCCSNRNFIILSGTLYNSFDCVI